MLEKISLAKKLSIGFGGVLILLAIVGMIGFSSLNNATDGFSHYRAMARDTNLAGRVQANMLMVRMNVKDYIITASDKDKQQFEEYWKKTQGFIETAQKEIQDPARAQKIDEIDKELKKYHDGFEQVVSLIAKRNQLVKEVMDVSGPMAEKNLTAILRSAKEDGDMVAAYGASLATRNLLLARLYAGKFLDTNDLAAAQKVKTEFAEMDKVLDELNQELQNPKRRELLAAVVEGHEAYEAAFESVVEAINARNSIIAGTLDVIGPNVANLIEEVKLDIKGVQDTIGPQLQASNNKAVTLIVSLAIIAILLGVAVAVLITRGILRQMGGEPTMVIDVARQVAEGDLNINLPGRGEAPTSLYAATRVMVETLKEKAQLTEAIAQGDLTQKVELASDRDVLGKALQQMVANLSEILGNVQVAGEQIASGSSQVSDASQSLSQGATEQASSLEEMSASVNQLTSQTTANAENANQASQLSSTSKNAAEKGNHQMNEMVAAMDEINQASQNISKIIKVIDEIAFQTNLLALNAAVEAARAGQHGKGFAVVAEEVRNLAARSAKAAEETSDLIEGSVEKTVRGMETANSTADALGEIVNGITKVTDLIAEIAAASNEQAEGLTQINTGLTQIDQVTQQNTASAEESAAAAEELSSQAAQMREMLARFTLSNQASSYVSSVIAPPVQKAPGGMWNSPQEAPRQQIAAKQQINLDDDEFGKF